MIIGEEVRQLLGQCDHAFSKRQTLMTLWQEIADNFYVERADFTRIRIIGDEFADHLNSSYPLMVRRELGNAFSSMLRPMTLDWFEVTIADEKQLDVPGREWLHMATSRQRQAMYDRQSGFIRATKEGDQDFAAFGQCVISDEIDWRKPVPSLLYRCWHLRDVAWTEHYDGSIGRVYRKWKPTAQDLIDIYKDGVHDKVKEIAKKSPHQKIDCRVITIPTDQLKYEKESAYPWTKIVADKTNQHMMENTGQWQLGYTIPRWQTVSGSQYAYSPATVAGLPDARLLQAMTLTLLEAGEMAVRPPMVATKEAIRSDIALYPGGITWADDSYDERKGDVLRPMTIDKSGLPFGLEMTQDSRSMLASAFFLNKLSLPAPGQGGMGPMEVSSRIQEYIRDALPLFEPMEIEYNGGICENTFDRLMRAGVFGAESEIPQSLRGQDVRFRFRSPLHDAVDRKKGAVFMESKELLREAVELDPTAQFVLDSRTALRDALHGIGTPATWMRTPEEVDDEGDRLAEERNLSDAAGAATAGGAAIEQGARAAAAVQEVEAA